MPDLVLNWGLFGPYGTDFGDTQTVDTGGVNVTVDFAAQDEGAQAFSLDAEGYVADGEDFNPFSFLKLFGEGGDGDTTDTSVTTIRFDSSDESFGDDVENVSFRLNDIDTGRDDSGEPSDNHLDRVTVRAFDDEGNEIPVDISRGSDVDPLGANGAQGGDNAWDPTDGQASALVTIAGPVSRIEIDYENDDLGDQRIMVSDLHFSTTDADDQTPDANPDEAETDYETPVIVDVLDNDTDPQGQPLTVTDVSDGANGTVVIDPATGNPEYTPNPGFSGTDTFTYVATDPDGNSATGTVTVSVGEDDPNSVDAVDDTAETGFETPVVIPVLDNDSDPQGDGFTVTDTTDGANGTVAIDPGTGNPVYTPNPGFEGTDTFTYTITDDLGATDTATVTVTVGDDSELDGYVEGGEGDDLIDTAYTGDPEGDMIDNNDEILPGEGPQDDIVIAGGGDDTVMAGDGDDEVIGGVGDDELNGEDGDDSLIGEEGDDTLNGGDGDDTGRGGDGNDVIDLSAPGTPAIDVPTLPGVPVDDDPEDDRDFAEGGLGDDTLTTGDDQDTIDGGDGDDVINPGIDNDIVDAGDGDDLINDLQGADSIDGGAGDDTINAGIDTFSDYVGDDPNLPIGAILSDPNTTDGMDTVNGGEGNDVINTGDDADLIDGGTGSDTINAGIDDDTVTGGEGDDSILGGHGSDDIEGNAGDDYIDASAATSGLLFPNEPDATDPIPTNDMDTVLGGDGNDTIITGDDDDDLDGGVGDDVLMAGIDDDTVRGREGDDSLEGGLGADVLTGGFGDDTMHGDDNGTVGLTDDVDPDTEDNRDFLDGRQDDDVIFGGDDDDTLLGGNGDDSLDGGIDEDSIEGGAGDDTIIGGQGADTLFGQSGRDVFIGGDDGDVVDGGSSPDGINPEDGLPFDYDTLDLTGSAPTGGTLNVTYTSADREDGFVEFFDDTGANVGRLDFTDIENVVPCFTPGTAIATPKGERLVEELRGGDKIITRDNGIQEIRWIGSRTLTGHELARAPQLRPILIQKGSLGDNLPEHDMLVSPQHRLLVNNEKANLYFEENEVLAAAKHMTSLDGVDEVGTLGVTYVHFMFDRHEVVLSNGAWTESFQPGSNVLDGLGNAQRSEIFALFPELETAEGVEAFGAARRSLKKHEAKLVVR